MKKVVKTEDGEKSSIVYYEDGTKEELPEGMFIVIKDAPKEEKPKQDSMLKKYRDMKKGKM